MNRTRASLVVASTLLWLAHAATTGAQGPPSTSPEAREKMQALDRLVGEWVGEAWMQMGPDRREVVAQHENVEWAAGGETLLIRGLGKVGERVVHDAVATIAWDARAQRHVMWTYRAGGGPMTPEISVTAEGFVWGFTTPGGEIRFTQRFDDQGRWVESGERSGDGGQTWQPFFGMTLSKK